MLIALVILVMITLTEITLNYKKRIAYIFALYLADIFLLFSASLLFLITFTAYLPVNSIDRTFYDLFKNLHINIYVLSRIQNVGVAMTMVASVCMCNLLEKKHRLMRTAALSVPILIFLFINDPSVTYRLFMAIYQPDTLPIKLPYILSAQYINAFSLLIFTGYMAFPFMALIKYSKNTKIALLRKNALVSGICIALIDLFFIYNFLFGILSYVMPWKVDYNKMPSLPLNYDMHFFIIPITIIMGIMVLFLSIKYKAIGGISILTKKKMNQDFMP